MVLWKQLRFGHKSALKAYVSSEQLQNVSKCVCVCDVFYFSGAWNIYLAGFCSNPPFPLGPCPKMVVYNAGPATTIQKFTALLSASRTIQSNPSTRDRTLPRCSTASSLEVQSLPPTQRRQFRKKPSQKPVPCIVTLAWSLNYDPLIQSVERGTF